MLTLLIIREIVEHDPRFGARFLSECRDMLKEADKGDRPLYELAIKTVAEGLKNCGNHI